MAVARLIRTIAGIVVAVIVVAILLRVLGANGHNVVVSDIHDVGRTLVGPFRSLFSVHGAKASMAVNWGIAAVVYLVVAHLLARMIAHSVPRRRWARPVV